MSRQTFRTQTGHEVPGVTAAEMEEVDRVAVEEVGLQLLQMMENAGRTLAWHVRHVRDAHGDEDGNGPVAVVAGSGGNGGGGMACARHLANRDIPVEIVLDRPPAELSGVPAQQYRILDAMGVPTSTDADRIAQSRAPSLVVDALIGYGLTGDVRPPADSYIDAMNRQSAPVVSLDVPSGIDATSGEAHEVAVRPDRTVTLALPKTGLGAVSSRIYLADIAIPETVYDRLDIDYVPPFGDRDWVELQ